MTPATRDTPAFRYLPLERVPARVKSQSTMTVPADTTPDTPASPAGIAMAQQVVRGSHECLWWRLEDELP
jgi:hypothetical protein